LARSWAGRGCAICWWRDKLRFRWCYWSSRGCSCAACCEWTSYLVSQRTREIGIRVALGAQSVEVVGLVLRQALGLVAVGLAVGLAGSLVVSRVLGQMLYGLSTFDALTFVTVPVFLAAVAMLAAYIPARRAAKVDPMVALRYDWTLETHSILVPAPPVRSRSHRGDEAALRYEGTEADRERRPAGGSALPGTAGVREYAAAAGK